VWLTAFYMEGIAQQWYYRFECNRLDNNQGDPSWSQFCELVNQRFGPPTCSNPLDELCHLRCTGSVDDYQSEFLTLLARCGGVTEPQQIAIFWGSTTYRRRASEAANAGRGGGSCQSLRTTTFVRHEWARRATR
jgi:hypothetical protein